MKYFDTIKAGVVFFVAFAGIFFLVPHPDIFMDVNTIMTISTFLFAILAGFFISRLNQRYDSMRDGMAAEDACWVAIYRTSALFGKEFVEKMREVVDAYYVILYDGEPGKTYTESEGEVNRAYGLLSESDLSEVNDDVVGVVVGLLADVEKERNKIAVLAEERLTFGQWVVMMILVVIIIVSMFFMDRSIWFIQGSAVLMSTALLMVMFIIRDLQNFRFGGKILMEESGQEVFESIGKLRYYNTAYLKEGIVSVPKRVKKYRVGTVDKNGKRTVKVVTR